MSFEGGSGLVNFSGLASGLDSGNIIKAMMASAHVPIDNLRAHENIVKIHQGIYNKVSSLLQTLGSIGQGVESPAQFMRLGATASNPSVLAATVGTGAAAGSYSVVVQSLAQAQKTYSTGVAASSQAGLFGTGSISVQVGGATVGDITVDANTTLQDVANSINAANLGATASLVFDGTNYRLQVTGDNTGAANSIVFVENGTTLGLTDPANTPQAAQDATLIIDNFITVHSSTNTVADAIPGVTLQATAASTAAQTVRVAVDSESIGTSVQSLVDAYNEVMKEINAEAMYGGAVDPRKLVGDPTLQNLVLQMQKIVTSPVSGATGNYTALSQLGVSTQRDGTLVLDKSVLNAALAVDPVGVSRVFTNDTTAGTQGFAYLISNLADAYAQSGLGVLSQISSSMDTQTREMENRISKMEENLTLYEQNLQAQFYRLEQMVSKLKSQGAYLTQSAHNSNESR